MSAREWQPGDVAVVWINDRRELAVVRPRQEAGVKAALEFAYVSGGFDMVDDFAPGWNARPLVVIDPEDREQVERLYDAVEAAQNDVPYDAGDDALLDMMQAALRAFAIPTPPKPEEPSGLGAVVEDANGARFVRLDSSEDPWHEAKTSTWKVEAHAYADIAAVKVLSDGVNADA